MKILLTILFAAMVQMPIKLLITRELNSFWGSALSILFVLGIFGLIELKNQDEE